MNKQQLFENIQKKKSFLCGHIEKALYSYTGVYPALVQAFADAFGDGCQWINREDDARCV